MPPIGHQQQHGHRGGRAGQRQDDVPSDRRDRIEEEIARLERRILERRDSTRMAEDLEMVEALRRILVALRNEHRLIVETLDHAIHLIESPSSAATSTASPGVLQRGSSSPGTITSVGLLPAGLAAAEEEGGLESLVQKVQDAVRFHRPPPSIGHPRGAPSPQSPTHQTTGPLAVSDGEATELEMSMATYNYLCKYNLLRSPPSSKSSPTHHHSQPPPAWDTRILDEDLIRRMPKL